MKVKFHRWFQWFAVPFVALGFHIYFGYKVIGRENIPAGGCVVCPNCGEKLEFDLEDLSQADGMDGDDEV